MNVYEMEGFLRGKCLPGDLVVGESNAEYLVRKLNEASTMKAERDAQQKRAGALAVENAATNDRVQRLIQIISNADNDYCMCGDAMKNHIHGGCGHPTGMFDYHYNQWLESDNGTPATDAALAAIQAQGVENAAEKLYGSGYVFEVLMRHAAALREVK